MCSTQKKPLTIIRSDRATACTCGTGLDRITKIIGGDNFDSNDNDCNMKDNPLVIKYECPCNFRPCSFVDEAPDNVCHINEDDCQDENKVNINNNFMTDGFLKFYEVCRCPDGNEGFCQEEATSRGSRRRRRRNNNLEGSGRITIITSESEMERIPVIDLGASSEDESFDNDDRSDQNGGILRILEAEKPKTQQFKVNYRREILGKRESCRAQCQIDNNCREMDIYCLGFFYNHIFYFGSF